MNTRPEFHGSDIEKICSWYGLAQDSIVNFGANVNPLGFPPSVKEAIASHLELLSSYPDRDYTSLRETIGAYCKADPQSILPGNGSSELISLLIEERAPKKTLILGPTYSEYARELSFSGSSMDYYHLDEAKDFVLDADDLCLTLQDGYDFLILCNPNNPTSSAISCHTLKRILEFCSGCGIFVMIDETYIEFAPVMEEISAVPLTEQFENLMVLRGVSKFFAAPGLRLGYGICKDREFLQKLKEKQIPWSLNSIGAFAGEQLFRDAAYISRTRDLILSERDRLYTETGRLSAFKTYQPYGNFLLLRILREGVTAFDVFELCIRRGLMIRDCSSFQCLDGEFIRFCIMMPKDNDRLLEVLRTV